MENQSTTIRIILGAIILIALIVQNYRQNEAEKEQAHKLANYLSQDYEGLIIESAKLSDEANRFMYTIDTSEYSVKPRDIGNAIEPRACSFLRQNKLETVNIVVNEVDTNKLVFSALYFKNKCI